MIFSTNFKGVPRTDNPDLVVAYGNPVLIRNWQIYGLPRDGLSTENAVITQYTKRWPLFIDPQGQANKASFQIDAVSSDWSIRQSISAIYKASI